MRIHKAYKFTNAVIHGPIPQSELPCAWAHEGSSTLQLVYFHRPEVSTLFIRKSFKK